MKGRGAGRGMRGMDVGKEASICFWCHRIRNLFSKPSSMQYNREGLPGSESTGRYAESL